MAQRNIKEGGYQPISDPPPLTKNGPVPPEAVNPITGNPNPRSATPADGAGERLSSPTPPASDGD